MSDYRIVMLVEDYSKGWTHEPIAVIEESKARQLGFGGNAKISDNIEFLMASEHLFLEWRRWIKGERKSQPSWDYDKMPPYDYRRCHLDRRDEECLTMNQHVLILQGNDAGKEKGNGDGGRDRS